MTPPGVPVDTAVPVDGVVLAVRSWPCARPTAPPVVLLPATAETADDWDVVASVLSRTRVVRAVSLRGHGLSDWPGEYSIHLLAQDVIGLLRHLGGPPVDLVGHSLGGLVACRVAHAVPGSVRRLVLEDVGLPHPRTPAPPPRPDGDLPFDWRLVEQVRPEVDDPDPRWPSIVAGIPAPTLVVAGGATSPVPQRHVAELVGLLPDGRSVTVEAGHLVHAARPEEFTAHLEAFLGSR